MEFILIFCWIKGIKNSEWREEGKFIYSSIPLEYMYVQFL